MDAVHPRCDWDVSRYGIAMRWRPRATCTTDDACSSCVLSPLNALSRDSEEPCWFRTSGSLERIAVTGKAGGASLALGVLEGGFGQYRSM